ncbi:MAG: peroxiredoxin family protein [Armatimonadetes bacterium]|nr:peroxiredoxin family protein [Armatimonadota bacterium]
MGQLQQAYQKFAKRDTEIVVVDSQEIYRVADWQKKLKTPFTFLADPTAWVCAKYGVAKQLLVHEEWVNLPAAFIVDKQGTLRYARVGRGWPPSERATPEELLAHLP